MIIDFPLLLVWIFWSKNLFAWQFLSQITAYRERNLNWSFRGQMCIFFFENVRKNRIAYKYCTHIINEFWENLQNCGVVTGRTSAIRHNLRMRKKKEFGPEFHLGTPRCIVVPSWNYKGPLSNKDLYVSKVSWVFIGRRHFHNGASIPSRNRIKLRFGFNSITFKKYRNEKSTARRPPSTIFWNCDIHVMFQYNAADN